jgi:hypothetical protein
MDESTALVSGGSESIAPVETAAPMESPAPMPAEPPERTAVTSREMPYTPAGDQTIVAPADDPAPPTLTKDKRTNPAYVEWIARNLPTAKRTPREPAVSKEFKALGYSSNDEALQTLTTVRDLYEKPEGAGVALSEVEARSPEVFSRIRNLVIASNPQLSLKQSALLCGWDMDAEPIPDNDLPHDLARHIPPDLQQTARTLSRDLLYLWAEKGADTLVYNLQQEAQVIEAWQQQTAEFSQQWEKAITEAEATGRANLTALIGQLESAHHKELEKWKPFGANTAANEAVRRMSFAGALDHLLSDQKWLDIHNRMCGLIAAAPNGRLFGQHALADQAEREARQLAQQFSTRLGQMIRDQVKLVDSAIRGAIARGVEEALQQQANAPLAPIDESRSLRPGEPERNKNGKTNPAWMDWITKKVLTRGGQPQDSNADIMNEWVQRLLGDGNLLDGHRLSKLMSTLGVDRESALELARNAGYQPRN